jgi:anthranilate/para-aminobenzoate synthase component I
MDYDKVHLITDIYTGNKPYKSLISRALKAFPETMPLVFLGSPKSPVSLLATKLSQVNNQNELFNKKLGEFNCQSVDSCTYGPGYIGLISYDHGVSGDFMDIPLYRIEAGVIFHKALSKITHFDSGNNAEFEVSWRELFTDSNHLEKNHPLRLSQTDTEKDYIDTICAIKEDISKGRFYQLNYIRYFNTDLNQSSGRLMIDRYLNLAGPMGAIFEHNDVKLLSFSPEKLVEFVPKDDHTQAINCPIKGTIHRSKDPDEDHSLSKNLLSSEKDLAELHMIVDLIRNDLGKISEPHTVKVEQANQLLSFPTVHHLQARVTSRVDRNLTLKEIFSHLTPGGSITGCPKIEVIKAISEYENRPRRYFMGNCFYLSDGGQLNSSILIRSLVSENGQNYEYAAGSGITFRSDPRAEFEETVLKTQVVTD